MVGQKKERVVYLDYLRFLAVIAVITTHAVGQHWREVPIYSYEWNVLSVYNAVGKWAVPVFVMISGALFLDRDIPWRKLYSKYILRILVAFLFWSVIYVCIFPRGGYKRETVVGILTGHGHMWYMFMIIGLYMSVPIMRKIVETEWLMKYFLVASFIWGFVYHHVVWLLWELPNSILNRIGDVINGDVLNMEISMFTGYTFYYVLGYYLSKKEISKVVRRIIYFLGLVGAIATFFMTNFISDMNGEPIELYYGYFTINIMIVGVALFVFAKYNLKKDTKVIQKLSSCSFGIYLVHEIFLSKIWQYFGLHSTMFNPIFAVPCTVFVTLLASTVVIELIHWIPGLRKYVV